MLGEMPDGAVFRVKVRHNPLYLFGSSDVDEFFDQLGAQALVLKPVSNDDAYFRFFRSWRAR